MIPAITIGFGLVLTMLAIIGYTASDSRSVTALIPAFVGVPLILLGALGMARPSWRKHVMHVAAALTLLGFLAAGGRYAMNPVAPTTLGPAMIFTMAITCLVLLIIYVRSFIVARRQPSVL